MIDRDEFEQMNSEMLSDSNVSVDEVNNDSENSMVLNDAQSLGIQSNDGTDDDVEVDHDDVEVDNDNDVEGYVPLPMSEEQVSDQLSERRDNGDF